MKKLLFLLLATILPMMASAYNAYIDSIYYNFDQSAKTAEVTYLSIYSDNQNAYSGTVNIPASVTYNGVQYSVTSIGSFTFYSCSGLTSVTIPNSVTSIGDWAFCGCSGLTSVTIPNSVTSIGNDAFLGCSGLTSVHISDLVVWCNIAFGNSISNPLYYSHHLYFGEDKITDLVIPNSVTSIGNSAFSGCSGLTSVTIPNSVTSIGNNAFQACSGLTSVTIPNSVTSIGNNAFQACSGLTSVTIPNSVMSIGSNAFSGCSGITVKVPVTDYTSFCENIIIGLISSYIGKPVRLINKEGAEIKDYVVPEGVTSIGNSAFRNCSGLTSVTIPNSVTRIGEYAFYGCSGLTSVTIPNSVTSIGNDAFQYCSGLTSVTIGNGLTSIGYNLFSGCDGFSHVKVPVTNFSAFCENKVVGCIYSSIGKPVQLINNDGTVITEYVVPEGVSSISNNAFRNCTSLTSVTIDNSVTSIGNNAFSGCTALMTVKSHITVPFDVGKFSEETYHQGTLYVPAGTKDLYIRFDGWREFLNIVEMGEEPAPNGQCAKPIIIIAGKGIRYECETPGAEFESILTTEEQRFTGNKLVMENRDLVYILTVYATAPGYDRSEPAQVKFVVSRNDVNRDGSIDVADIATIIDAMASEARQTTQE